MALDDLSNIKITCELVENPIAKPEPVSPFRFHVGQWVMWDNESGHHVGRIDLPCVHTAEASVTYNVGSTWGHSFGWQPGKQPKYFRRWQPRPGDRVCVTKCEAYPDVIGKIVTYEPDANYNHRFSSGSCTWDVGTAEFEPVFDEPSEQPVAGEMREVSFGAGAVQPRGMRRYTIDGQEVTDEIMRMARVTVSSPDEIFENAKRLVRRGEIRPSKEPGVYDFIADRLREKGMTVSPIVGGGSGFPIYINGKGVTATTVKREFPETGEPFAGINRPNSGPSWAQLTKNERTHPTLAPRADRYAARKAEAMAVLSGSWNGRRDR